MTTSVAKSLLGDALRCSPAKSCEVGLDPWAEFGGGVGRVFICDALGASLQTNEGDPLSLGENGGVCAYLEHIPTEFGPGLGIPSEERSEKSPVEDVLGCKQACCLSEPELLPLHGVNLVDVG